MTLDPHLFHLFCSAIANSKRKSSRSVLIVITTPLPVSLRFGMRFFSTWCSTLTKQQMTDEGRLEKRKKKNEAS